MLKEEEGGKESAFTSRACYQARAVEDDTKNGRGMLDCRFFSPLVRGKRSSREEKRRGHLAWAASVNETRSDGRVERESCL